MSAPEQGVDRCECGCKYWTASGAYNADGEVWRCIDCGDRFQDEPNDPPAHVVTTHPSR